MKRSRLSVAAAPLVAMALHSGCEPATEKVCVEVGQRPVDQALVAFLSRARSAHHLADQAEAAGDRVQAIAVLMDLTEGPLPTSNDLAPETREVLADTLGRIAHLRSEIDDYAGASRAVEKGLSLAPKGSYYEGYLLEVRGLIEERRAARAAARQNHAEAESSRAKAIDAFARSMRIQAEVLEVEARRAEGGSLGSGKPSAGPSRADQPAAAPPADNRAPVRPASTDSSSGD